MVTYGQSLCNLGRLVILHSNLSLQNFIQVDVGMTRKFHIGIMLEKRGTHVEHPITKCLDIISRFELHLKGKNDSHSASHDTRAFSQCMSEHLSRMRCGEAISVHTIVARRESQRHSCQKGEGVIAVSVRGKNGVEKDERRYIGERMGGKSSPILRIRVRRIDKYIFHERLSAKAGARSRPIDSTRAGEQR